MMPSSEDEAGSGVAAENPSIEKNSDGSGSAPLAGTAVAPPTGRRRVAIGWPVSSLSGGITLTALPEEGARASMTAVEFDGSQQRQAEREPRKAELV